MHKIFIIMRTQKSHGCSFIELVQQIKFFFEESVLLRKKIMTKVKNK